jgi:hypothetical protein
MIGSKWLELQRELKLKQMPTEANQGGPQFSLAKPSENSLDSTS